MYTIQVAAQKDIDLIRQLTWQVWPSTYANILSKEQIDYMLEMMYSVPSLEKQMTEGAKFIIISDNSNPVGFASYQQIHKSVFKLHKLYVLPSQQGKGTGKKLIDYISEKIKETGDVTLQLQVNRNNNARIFYEKMGFTIVKQCTFDIGNGYVMDDYIMEKVIK